MFGLVGVVGFVVDSSVLYAAITANIGIYAGRALSYLVAVTTTWALNRRYTFKPAPGRSLFAEWVRFAVSQTTGATLNIGVYAALVHTFPLVASHPVIGVAAGSLSGMLVNFFVARKFAFLPSRGGKA